MSFDSLKRQYTKEHLWIVELDIKGETYRFCENIVPLPTGLNAIPSLKSASVNPAQINIDGGFGVRAKCSVSFEESLDYSIWGSLSNPVRFWSRWRAENPYYLGQTLSLLSGYIENGEYNEDNFIRRDYVIESFSQGANGASLTGKDPLKLASNDRAKAPVESNGSLISDLIIGATTFTLQPTGIGSEYPASNGTVRVGDEVMAYTTRTGDTISGVSRGAYNTEEQDHSTDDAVQACLVLDSLSPYEIDYLLLTEFANIPTSYINLNEWESESDNTFNTTYTTIITEPTGVQDLINEFCESAPHYLYWDERVNQIRWSGLKPPPSNAPEFTYEGNLIEGSTSVKDMQDMRVSTVIINYGVIDPTQNLDEPANYRATYVREDSTSVTEYGQRAYKKINSRWIPSDNKTAAVLMGARIGRRFAFAPRMLGFSLDPKDSDVWTGDSIRVISDLIEQQGGGFPSLFYQVLSAQESRNYNYTALEHSYGDALPQDEDVEDPNVRIIYINGLLDQLKDDSGVGTARDLREYYEDIFGTDPLDPDFDVRFIFESNCVAGSESASFPSVDTGSWPELLLPPIIINNGLIVGRGGNGSSTPAQDGGDGGIAINMSNDIRLNNLGTVGGGGGGGGVTIESEEGGFSITGGGGGAGYFVGTATAGGQDGTYTLGGQSLGGAKGGNLGQNGFGGSSGGGTAGAAIVPNGFTITYIEYGTINGDAPAGAIGGWSPTGNEIDLTSETSSCRGVISAGGKIYALSNNDLTIYQYDGTTYTYDSVSQTFTGLVFAYDFHYAPTSSTRWVCGNGLKVVEYNNSMVATGNSISTISTPNGFCRIGSNYYVAAAGIITEYDATYTATGNSFAHGYVDVVGLDTDGTRIFYVQANGNVYSTLTDGTSAVFEATTGLTATGITIESGIMLISTSSSLVEFSV